VRTLKLLPISILIFASIYPASASRVSMLDARKSLIAYAIQFEARGKTSVAKADYKDWLKSFSFTPEAKAYANGETCLVLGFKSTFQNGLCRLSTAEGAEQYKSSCSDGGLPCNPVVFGKGEGGSVFCASSSAGSQLSKSCAFQTFQYLNTKSEGGIAGLASMSERTFDLSKLSFRAGNEKLKQVAEAIFSGESSLDSAHAFIDQLCQDIATGKKTGNQPQDLKTCLGYRNFLDAAKTPITKANAPVAGEDDDVQDPAVNPSASVAPTATAAPTAAPTTAPSVSPAPTTMPSTPTPTPKSDCCTINAGISAIPVQTQSSVSSIVKDISSKVNSSLPCQSELDPVVASWGMGSFDHPSSGAKRWPAVAPDTYIGYYGPFIYKEPGSDREQRAPPRAVFNAKSETALAKALKDAGIKESPRKAIGEVARYSPVKFGDKVSILLTGYTRMAGGNLPVTSKDVVEVILTKDCKFFSVNVSLEGNGENNIPIDAKTCATVHSLSQSRGLTSSDWTRIVGRPIKAFSAQEILNACGPNGSLVNTLK
jgi:hypothetical protein